MRMKRRALSIFMVVLMLLSVIFPAAALADTKRIGGNDRFLTAVQVSQSGWAGGSDTAVLVNAYSFKDAAAAGPLAFKLNAPVLLTEADMVQADTLKEIQRLKAKTVILIGGTGVISAGMEADLKKSGLTVIRYGGEDCYATAAKIAEAMGKAEKAAVVTSEGYADALAVASWAAANHAPILYTATESLPASTKQALTAAGVTSTVVAGGEGVVSKAVFDLLPNPRRFAGNDRYETATAVAAALQPNAETVFVATGLNFVDAMIGANLAAKTDSPLIYVEQAIPTAVSTYLKAAIGKVKNLSIIGGSGVVSYLQKAELLSLLNQGDLDKGLTDAVASYFTNMGSDSYKIPEATLRDELDKNPDKYVVLDIRRADAYAKGHIPGAINVPYGPEIAKNLDKIRAVANGKTLIVACYTGQTAGQTDSLLNLAGIKTRSLNFGMGKDGFENGWLALAAKDPSYKVVTEATPMPDAPAVASPNKMIDDAVKEYFENMPADSYKISIPDLKTALASNPDKYVVVDVRQPDVFTKSHIKWAINVPYGPKIAENLAMLKEKAQGKIMVVYCYTGQTAGQVDSLLNILGINAKSLDFGFGTDTFKHGWSADPSNEVVEGFSDAVAAYFANMPADIYKIPEATLKDELEKNPDKYVVLDIRKPDAYAKGHIKGAINVPFGPEIAKNLDKIRAVANAKTLIVACYTGQTAGQTDSLLNLAGIKTRSLNFGMGMDGFEKGWLALGYPVVTEPTAMPDAPAVASPNKTIDDAVKKYFENMPADSYKIDLPALRDALVTHPENYLVVDVRKAADYAKGHIKGAINVPFDNNFGASLSMLKEKAQGKIMVVYCYTGQTAGQTDSLMNIIGINTRSLNFGFGTTNFSKGWSALGYEIVTD